MDGRQTSYRWRPGRWALGGITLLALFGCLWLSLDPMTREMALGLLGLDDNPVRIGISGRVLDPLEAPVPGARVHGEWRAVSEGRTMAYGSFDTLADSDGRYWQVQSCRDDNMVEQSERLRVELTVRAHGAVDEYSPSDPVSFELPRRAEVRRDLTLGERRTGHPPPGD